MRALRGGAVRLTRAQQNPADDLGQALAARFGDGDPVGEGAPPAAPSVATEGDTLLPGEDLVEELRRQVTAEELRRHVAALQELEAAKHPVPQPEPEAPARAELPPPLPAATEPPVDPAAASPGRPPLPVRFGPTTAAPPPLDLPMPSIDAAVPPAVDAPARPEPLAGFEPFTTEPPPPPPPASLAPEAPPAPEFPPAPEPPAPEPNPEPKPEVQPGAAGVIKIKKSSERRVSAKSDRRERRAAEKSERRRFGRRQRDESSGVENDAVARIEAAVTRPVTDDAPHPEDGEDLEGGPRHVGRPLGELLVGRGLVSEDQLREALTSQTGSGKRLGNILVELGLLSERTLAAVLAEQLQVDIVELGRMTLDQEIVTLLPEDDARRLRAVPIAREGVRIDVAVAYPLAAFLQDELIAKLAAPVRLVFATGTDIEAVINKMHAPAADLGDALRMFEARLVARKTSKESESAVTTVVDEN